MTYAAAAYKELVYGGHLLALGTASMAATASYLLNKLPTWDLLLMAYLFSLGAYTINRISDLREDEVSHPERTDYLKTRKGSLPLIVVACFSLGYVLAFIRNLTFFAGLLVPVGLALVYSVGSREMKETLGVSRLKDATLVKNVTISFGWSLVPVLVGLYFTQLTVPLLALAPFIFLRLMVNTIFFDQRDLAADKQYGVATLAVKLGISGSSKVIEYLDLASAAYLVLVTVARVLPIWTGGMLLFVPYSFGYRLLARSLRFKDLSRDLAADGEYLLWGFVTYIGHL